MDQIGEGLDIPERQGQTEGQHEQNTSMSAQELIENSTPEEIARGYIALQAEVDAMQKKLNAMVADAKDKDKEGKKPKFKSQSEMIEYAMTTRKQELSVKLSGLIEQERNYLIDNHYKGFTGIIKKILKRPVKINEDIVLDNVVDGLIDQAKRSHIRKQTYKDQAYTQLESVRSELKTYREQADKNLNLFDELVAQEGYLTTQLGTTETSLAKNKAMTLTDSYDGGLDQVIVNEENIIKGYIRNLDEIDSGKTEVRELLAAANSKIKDYTDRELDAKADYEFAKKGLGQIESGMRGLERYKNKSKQKPLFIEDFAGDQKLLAYIGDISAEDMKVLDSMIEAQKIGGNGSPRSRSEIQKKFLEDRKVVEESAINELRQNRYKNRPATHRTV